MNDKTSVENKLIEAYQKQNKESFERIDKQYERTLTLISDLTENVNTIAKESVKFHEVSKAIFVRLEDVESEQRQSEIRVRVLENKSTANETLKSTMGYVGKITLGSIVAAVTFLSAYYFKSL